MTECIRPDRLDFTFRKSELTGLEVALEDYREREKQHFTYEEAIAVEKKLKNTGWRLPTRSEWVLLCEEFGQKNGRLDSNILQESLKINFNGRIGGGGILCSADSTGLYWSSTTCGSSNAYALYLDPFSVISAYNDAQYQGFSIRLVKGGRNEKI